MKNNLLYYIAIALGLIFVLLSVLVITDNISWYDRFIYTNFIYHTDKLSYLMKGITEFGDVIILSIIAFLSLLVFKQRKIGFLIIINLIVSFIICESIKLLFLRSRPVENILTSVTGYSFPSGHSTVSMAFYGFIIYLIITKIDNKKLKYLSTCILSLIILLVGYSRIYLGAHYASDVLGGFLLGLIIVTLYVKLFVIKVLNN